MATRSSPLTVLNDRTGLALLVLVALSAVPFGSNRPFFWSLWAFAVAFGGLIYFASLARLHDPLRLSVGALRVEFALFGAVALAILIQILPLGGVLGSSISTSAGLDIRLSTLSLSPGDTWLAFLRWTTYGLVFFLTLQVGLREGRVRFLSRMLALIVAAQALYALLALAALGDTILIFEKIAYFGTATGTFVNRNSLATYLSIGAVLCAVELMRSDTDASARSRLEGQAFFLVALGLIVAALFATQSRMGLFAGVLGVATVVLARGGLRANPLLLAGGLGGFVLLAFFYGGGVLDRALLVEQSALQRGELYRQVFAMILERPWTGYGAGSFRMAFPLFHDPLLRADLIWDYAHSTYLALWSGLGLFAGSLPVVLVGSILFAIVRRRPRTGERGPFSSAAAGALGSSVVVATHSLVDFSLEMQAVALLYTVVLALGAAPAFAARARDARPDERRSAALRWT